MNAKTLTKIIILIFGFLYFWGCTAKKDILRQKPSPPAFPLREYQELVNKGDHYFSRMHLYGWRKAEEFYSKAYEMKPSAQLRDKRFLALCLTAIREKQEKIINPSVYQAIEALGDFPENQKQQYLLEIVRHYQTLPVIRKEDQRIASKEKKEVDVTLFDLENSPLDTYLFLYCLNYYAYDLKAYNEELNRLLETHQVFALMGKYAMSPLFIYFNYNSVAGREAEVEQGFPEFAEFLVFKGNKLFSKNKLKQASRYYKKALELIPDYTKAINGIGNIYYFTINDYETALTYYQQTLDLDELNPVALFGKGVSLHFLEKYPESNQVFDFMLENQEMYHGEAYYYKAYNCYHMKDPAKARELVDRAKTFLPHSGEVLFLSGLLYYNQGKMKEAERDFLRVLFDRQYSPCYPLYYLGMIKIKNQDWSFFRDFSDSIQCFATTIQTMSNRLQQIDSLDIEDFQKEWMKKQQTAKLQVFKEASDQLIRQMNTIIAQNKDRKKAYDQQRSNEALTRVKNLLAKDPGRLNQKDQKNQGNTLLHEAVQNKQMNVVRLLLSRGALIDIKEDNGYTPLHWAVMLGFTDIARLLISNGADFKQTGPNNMTLLHDAAYNGHKEIVQMLLEKGAPLDAKDSLGNTPLDLAIEKQQKPILALLKPLHLSVEKGELALFAKTLKKYPHQLNTGDENGRTPLHLAAAKGNKEIAWQLLDQGANINARDTDGFTPMELAAQQGHTQMVQLLQSRGAQLGNKEILAKELREKQAVLWYLGGHGWAIKTKNHFLILDYHPLRLQLKRMPAAPLLANGQIDPSELPGQNIFVILTQEVLETGNRGIISVLANSLKPVTYISSGVAGRGSQFVNISHHEEKQVAGMDILPFKSPGQPERMGYFIRVDGLVIFYPGNRGYWSETVWEEYRQEIQYLRNQANNNEGTSLDIDIAFLPLQGSGVEEDQREKIEKGVISLLKQLQPGILFTMTPEGDEYLGTAFKEAAKKNFPAHTKILCPEQRGDRFFY